MRLPAVLWWCVLAAPAVADEGMWPFNQFPKDAILQKYKFEVPAQFLDDLRLASARVGAGSGSFVSAEGLLLTNQHLVTGCLGDRVNDGYYASTREAELRCPGLEAAVLLETADVTERVKAAAKEGTPAAQAIEQRGAAMAALEKECAGKTGNRCTVVTLFSGGRYDMYQYKTYGDVRLVFAPEHDLAFFGRQRDAITYLRYGLDIAFLRVYENGKPAATPHYLKWSAEEVKEGDLVFSAGNPTATARLVTSAQLAFYRDTALPLAVARLGPRIQQLTAFAAQSAENQKAAEATLEDLLNRYKLAAGKLIGLRDDRLVARKTIFETRIKRALERDPKLAEASKVWDEVASAYKSWAPFEKAYQVLEGAPAPGSILFRAARQTVRKQDHADSPVNDGIETLMLAQYLEELKQLGEKEAPAKAILAGKSPQQAAEALVKSARAKDMAPLIHMAQLLEPAAQKIRKKHQELIASLEASAVEKIAQYRLRLFGAAEYPDATGTPRVEFGVVKGYRDRAAVTMPYAATFGGLYYRKNNEGPYQVPQRWVEAKTTLNLVTPLDFVSTCDIGGGDYGGPVVNRTGELVGVTFDGNLESLPDVYLYSDEQARAVHVSVQGIAEALEKVYKAAGLLGELGAKRERPPAGSTESRAADQLERTQAREALR